MNLKTSLREMCWTTTGHVPALLQEGLEGMLMPTGTPDLPMPVAPGNRKASKVRTRKRMLLVALFIVAQSRMIQMSPK